MDYPHFLHQQHHHHHHQPTNRYAPLPPPPPNPNPPLPPPPSLPPHPRPNFPSSTTTNFHSPHHQNHQFPQPQNPQLTASYQFRHPPPPPPQQQQQHRHHLFNPTQSQSQFQSQSQSRFTFSTHPLEDRIPPEIDRPRHPDTNLDFWNPSRVLPDTRPTRAVSPPYRPIDKYRHDTEGISRFRVENKYNDGFDPNQRKELVWGRGDDKNYHRRDYFVSNSDTTTASREFGFGSNLRDIESNSAGSYNHRFGSVRDNEVGRSGRIDGSHDRIASRDLRGSLSFDMKSNEISDGHDDDDDGARIGFGKREYYASELGRFSNRGSKEVIHDYNRTPRKQIQKKSALLRIQMVKPNHRNRDSDHYFGYYDKNNSGSFRGKDQFVYLGHGVEKEEELGQEEEKEEEREGSPVELDVSFKSNSLVAKAIVAPSTSAFVSYTDMNPRDRKNRKVFDGDCSNSRLIKLTEGTVNLDSSTRVANEASGSDKDLKQLEEKVMTSGIGNVCDGSAPSSNATNMLSQRKSIVERSPKGMVPNKDDTNVGSGKSSLKVVKKKKVVKKVVKKVINPNSHLLSSQQTNKCDEPVKAESSTRGQPAASGSSKGITPLKQIIASNDMSSMHNAVLPPCTDEVDVLPETDKADGPPLAVLSDECGIDVDSGRPRVPMIERFENSPTSQLVSSSHKECKIDEGPVNGNKSVCSSHRSLTSDNDLIEPLIEIKFSDIGSVEGVSKQICHNGASLSLENGAEKGSSEAIFSLQGNINSDLLSSQEIKIHEDIASLYTSAHGAVTTLGFDYTIKSQENVTICDVGIMDAIRKQPCTNQVATSLENSTVERIPKAIFSVGSSSIVGSLSSECSNHGGNDKQPSPGGVTISLENCAIKKSIKKSPNTIVSVRASEGNMQKNKKRKKVRTQLDFSSSRISDIYVEPVNDIVSPAHAVDTTSSLSVNDHSPAKVAVPGVGSLDVVLHPSNDSVNVLHGNSSADGFSEVQFTVRSDVDGELDGASPRYKSKREVSGSHSALSRPTVFETNEGPAGTSTSCAEVPLTNDDDLKQAEEEVAVSSINTLCTTGLIPCPNGISSLLENSLGGGSFDAVASIRNADDDLQLQHHGVDFCSNPKDSTIQNEESPCPSGLGSEPKENTMLVMAVNINQNNTTDIENSGEGKMDVQSALNQVLTCSGTAQCRISSDLQPPDLDQRFPGTNMGSDYLLVKDDLPSVSNFMSLSIDGAGVSASNSNDEVESLSGTLLDIGSPESLSKVPGINMLSCKASVGQIANEKVCGDDKSVVEGGPNVSAHTSFPQYTKADLATESDHSIMGKTEPLLSQDFKNTTRSPNLISADLTRRKTQLGHAIPRTFPGSSSFVSTTSKKIVSSTSIAKPRTWHRTGSSSAPLPGNNKPFSSSVPPQRQLTGNNVKPQSTSYIRKGNSLVRKPAPVSAQHQGSHGLSSSVYWANSSCNNESKKNTGSDSRVDATNPQNLLRTGGKNASFERPRTPPLPNGTKLSTRTVVSSGDYTSSPLAEHIFNGCSETTSDPMKYTETNNVPKSSAEDASSISETPENQTGPSNNLETLTELNDGSVASLNMKRIVYVKRKSNQLVATSNPCDLSVQNGDKIQAASDGYYKRSKNQLIRASLENHKQTVAMPDDISNSERQQIPKIVSSRKFSKGRLHRVVGRTFKPKKSSLVWTLCGTQSSKNNVDSLHHQKVLPHLFPWKRATYWRSFMQNPASISNNSSVSMISRKLLLLRKRDTVYTRSSHGFSLRKSRVLSVGGSSLKWSKSIEKHSKKANEEATLAVAAVEKKKREQNSAACSISEPKNRNHSPRERIYRIGSVRYKMDSSKRTLQRILDDESTCSTALQSEKDAKKSYIPRRLVIGNDEYVRIGNGNQLIRDPKKRTRILASEKVRWSLHTARQRLARKRKYCQFFTRFGTCNKDDGKCPYIHDPSKIAVCTKFLNGLCFNPNCKLTHKVIPERMPDCSYFLQGLCNNRSCPYRHVNVNPKASSCEGFLRGYCADGNECRKKHTYVCPIFEATRTCPQGSKCKLHHPKSRSKGKKRKRSGEQKNGLGRYFRSMHINVSEPGTVVYEKHSKQTNDDIFLEGKIVDYVSLDVSDEEVGERNDATCQQTFCDSDSSDVELDDIDELIKPILIMNKNLTT